ncbi:MAG: ADP-ribose pyrophosphatase YjhB (NUDIX family) [Myxococcota bacterium]|jgi:ADP-ribose pyrophosphatase YjhB (NUDIX family)
MLVLWTALAVPLEHDMGWMDSRRLAAAALLYATGAGAQDLPPSPAPAAEPSTAARCVAAGCAVIVDGKILLVNGVDGWSLPGGGHEPMDGGDCRRTAERETAEEAAVVARVPEGAEPLLGPSSPSFTVYACGLAGVDEAAGVDVTSTRQTTESRFFTAGEILAIPDPDEGSAEAALRFPERRIELIKLVNEAYATQAWLEAGRRLRAHARQRIAVRTEGYAPTTGRKGTFAKDRAQRGATYERRLDELPAAFAGGLEVATAKLAQADAAYKAVGRKPGVRLEAFLMSNPLGTLATAYPCQDLIGTAAGRLPAGGTPDEATAATRCRRNPLGSALLPSVQAAPLSMHLRLTGKEQNLFSLAMNASFAALKSAAPQGEEEGGNTTTVGISPLRVLFGAEVMPPTSDGTVQRFSLVAGAGVDTLFIDGTLRPRFTAGLQLSVPLLQLGPEFADREVTPPATPTEGAP